MPKSWLTLSGSVILLFAVISLYLNTERQRTGERFQTSLQSLLAAVMASTSPSIDITANGDRWAMPSYQDYIATWQAQQTGITLDEADLATPQETSPDHGKAQIELSETYGLVQNTPHFITHLKQGLASLSEQQDHSQALQPMMRPRLSAVSFQPGDRSSIERYANRQHLPEGALELPYLDAATTELLLSIRRVLTEDEAVLQDDMLGLVEQDALTGEQLPRPGLEVAPGGGRYWIEDPNAAWW